jgi:NADPH:quinone reductase-like Zn-dependent oxidoreductase
MPAALPAAAEAALGILKQLRVMRCETLLVLGAAGSVGMIAMQLAASCGVTVIGAAAPRDQDLVRSLGAIPVTYGDAWLTGSARSSPSVDAVADAARKGGLGVAFSVGTPDRAPEALDQTMPVLATGTLRIRRERQLPMAQAAEAHRLLENGDTHETLIRTPAEPA